MMQLKHTCFFSKIFILVLMCCLLPLGRNLQAQEQPIYSQYMFNMLPINPAYAGNSTSDNISLIYRRQWMGVKGAPNTAFVTADKLFENSNIGLGVELFNDQIGVEKSSGLLASYAYHISGDYAQISLGVSGGIINHKVDYTAVSVWKGGDPSFLNDENTWYPTAGIGLFLKAASWYMGLSAPSFLQIKGKSVQVNSSGYYFLTGGYSFTMDEYNVLIPSFMAKSVAGAGVQFDMNLMWWWNDKVGIGVNYRLKDAIVGLLEFQIAPQWRVGYSYDRTISDFSEYNKGSHEILLRYILPRSDY